MLLIDWMMQQVLLALDWSKICFLPPSVDVLASIIHVLSHKSTIKPLTE